jgi:NAD+ kinase
LRRLNRQHPVGSTAHALSAGGPILRNDIQALAIVPISPHTLTHRPVVDSAERTIELTVPKPHEGTSLVVDGRVLGTLEPGDRVRVVRSNARFQLVEVRGQRTTARCTTSSAGVGNCG